mgnify:CR=1 FL=1
MMCLTPWSGNQIKIHGCWKTLSIFKWKNMVFSTTRPEIWGTFGAVSPTHRIAPAFGFTILEKDGKAFDAAVATRLFLQVVEPHLKVLQVYFLRFFVVLVMISHICCDHRIRHRRKLA